MQNPFRRPTGYFELCEELYAAWRSGSQRLARSTAALFTLEHCPEPYLLFGERAADEGCAFVSTNPGRGRDFQLRPEVSETSFLKPIDHYAQAAGLFGAYYASPRADIAPAARANVASMRRIAEIFGAPGVIQIELAPWHSPELPGKARTLAALARDEPVYRAYQAAVRDLLAHRPLVMAWSAGLPSRRSGEGVEAKAAAIGMDLRRCDLLELDRTDDVSQGLLWTFDRGRFRGVFVTQGAAVLPATGTNRAGQDKDALLGDLARSLGLARSPA